MWCRLWVTKQQHSAIFTSMKAVPGRRKSFPKTQFIGERSKSYHSKVINWNLLLLQRKSPHPVLPNPKRRIRDNEAKKKGKSERKLSILHHKFKGWKMRRSITYSSEHFEIMIFLFKTLPQTPFPFDLRWKNKNERKKKTKTTFLRFFVIDFGEKSREIK